MQDKMKKLLEQIGMSNQYFESARVEKIVVYDKTNLWEFIIKNDKVLPVYIYDELCNKLKDTFKSIEIPLGYFFGRNYFLSNGVKVPIELEVIGNQSIEIKSSVESYGINTTILKVELHVSLDIQSVIPFQSAKIKTNTIIPLSLEIINNEIPYYLGDLLEWIFLFIFLK